MRDRRTVKDVRHLAKLAVETNPRLEIEVDAHSPGDGWTRVRVDVRLRDSGAGAGFSGSTREAWIYVKGLLDGAYLSGK